SMGGGKSPRSPTTGACNGNGDVERPTWEETMIVPPDLARRCEIYLLERLPWFDNERKPPEGSPRDRQLHAAIREWWRALPAPEREQVFVYFVEQCLEDLVE